MESSSVSRICPRCKTHFGESFAAFTYCPLCYTSRLITLEEFEAAQAGANMKDKISPDEEPWVY